MLSLQPPSPTLTCVQSKAKYLKPVLHRYVSYGHLGDSSKITANPPSCTESISTHVLRSAHGFESASSGGPRRPSPGQTNQNKPHQSSSPGGLGGLALHCASAPRGHARAPCRACTQQAAAAQGLGAAWHCGRAACATCNSVSKFVVFMATGVVGGTPALGPLHQRKWAGGRCAVPHSLSGVRAANDFLPPGGRECGVGTADFQTRLESARLCPFPCAPRTLPVMLQQAAGYQRQGTDRLPWTAL